MKILYVEDNMANLYLVKRIAHGHEVINYIDGEEALANIQSVQPDLIFMDIQLVGEMSGLDVVRVLRAKGYTTPIVAVTAYAMVGDREKCIEAGCDEYLAKPLPIPEVLALIQRYDSSGTARPSAPLAPKTVEPRTVETATEKLPIVNKSAPAESKDGTSPVATENGNGNHAGTSTEAKDEQPDKQENEQQTESSTG